MLLVFALTVFASADAGFVELTPGVEYRTFALQTEGSWQEDLLHVVRVDPAKATLSLGLASRDGSPQTAAAWARQLQAIAVINAGMYEQDGRSNVGHLVAGAHVNQGRWRADYRSALVIEDQPRLVDLDVESRPKAPTVLQNLRLLKGPPVQSVWKPNDKRWSEAALAMDDRGRMLLVFVRSGQQMSEFNQVLIALPLGIVRAMHLDGGPPASLSIRSPKLNLDLAGSYETGLFATDRNQRQWNLPNVIAVVPKGP